MLFMVMFMNNTEKYCFTKENLKKRHCIFEKALLGDPNNRSLINLMGICLKDLSRLKMLLKYYNIAIKAYPTDTKVLFNKALCFIEMKEFERAKKLCEYILTLEPENEKGNKEDRRNRLTSCLIKIKCMNNLKIF